MCFFFRSLQISLAENLPQLAPDEFTPKLRPESETFEPPMNSQTTQTKLQDLFSVQIDGLQNALSLFGIFGDD